MKEKAIEKGISTCPNCSTLDIFYSLLGKCSECNTVFEEKPKVKKLLFTIEVLVEFTEKYDECMPNDVKRIFLQLGKAIINKIKTENTVDNSKLIQFQYQCNHIPQLGSNKFGGAIDGKKMAIQMVESIKNPVTVGKSLSAVILSIIFIRKYKVPNEFKLETNPQISKSAKSGGCLGMLVTLTLLIGFLCVFIF